MYKLYFISYYYLIFNFISTLWKIFNYFLIERLINLFNGIPDFNFNNFRKYKLDFDFLNFESKYKNIIYISLILSLLSIFKVFGITPFLIFNNMFNYNLKGFVFTLIVDLMFFYLLSLNFTVKKLFNFYIKFLFVLFIIKSAIQISPPSSKTKNKCKSKFYVHHNGSRGKEKFYNKNFFHSTAKYREIYNFDSDNSSDKSDLGDYSVDLEYELSDRENKESTIKYKGHQDYNQIFPIGSVESLTLESFNDKITELKDKIEDGEILNIIPTVLYKDEKSIQRAFSIRSTKLGQYTNNENLFKLIMDLLLKMSNEYLIEKKDCFLILKYKTWIHPQELDFIKKDVPSALDDQLEGEVNNKYTNPEIFDKLVKNKIDTALDYRYKSINIENYGTPFYQNGVLIGYRLSLFSIATPIYFEKNNYPCIKVEIRDISNKNKVDMNSDPNDFFIDKWTKEGWCRTIDKYDYFYNNKNTLKNLEKKYNFPTFPLSDKSEIKKTKIGTIDFETFGETEGLGLHKVYAGGWAIENKTLLFYKKRYQSSKDLTLEIIKSIFDDDIIMKGIEPSNQPQYTFYAHNMGRFDGLFLIEALVQDPAFKLIPTFKDNALMSLDIIYQFKKEVIIEGWGGKKIKIKSRMIRVLDSLQMIKGSLDNILKSFNCNITKGYFPYSFVNKNNLYYVGSKPDFKFYNKISRGEYNLIPIKNWSLKKETHKYLKSDLEGLLEAVLKFNDNIFKQYHLNMSDFRSFPGLSLAIFTSNFLNPENNRLKVIKGNIEKEIRTSYFGGNVDVYINKIDGGYFYDMNSQYPFAMLRDMPVGDPKLSYEKDLNNYFGFVYGEITAPDKKDLLVPFIQYKDPSKLINSCPRGKFKRMIFSEEMKYAVKHGYKINIEYGYQFERGKDVFKDYILYHYEIKKSATDSVLRNIAKLGLNSLYGRMGMKDIVEHVKVMDSLELEKLNKNYNYEVMAEFDYNKILVKIGHSLSSETKKLLSGQTPDKTPDYQEEKVKGIPSCVHIASAIASYARISINEYKNIPGNPCIYSDTDSVVLPYPLPDHLIGDELGQMKLVHIIKIGIFIRKKFYYLLDSNDNEIMKSSGINYKNLDFNKYIKLLNGEDIITQNENFRVSWKNLTLNWTVREIKTKGLYHAPKTILSKNDTNFKSISFPLVNNKTIENLSYSPKGKSDSPSNLKLSLLEKLVAFIFLFLILSLLILLLNNT